MFFVCHVVKFDDELADVFTTLLGTGNQRRVFGGDGRRYVQIEYFNTYSRLTNHFLVSVFGSSTGIAIEDQNRLDTIHRRLGLFTDSPQDVKDPEKGSEERASDSERASDEGGKNIREGGGNNNRGGI